MLRRFGVLIAIVAYAASASAAIAQTVPVEAPPNLFFRSLDQFVAAVTSEAAQVVAWAERSVTDVEDHLAALSTSPGGLPYTASAASAAPTPPPLPQFTTYTVEGGDTLSGIAHRYGVSLGALIGTNNLSHQALLHPGETLTIPPPPSYPCDLLRAELPETPSQNAMGVEHSAAPSPVVSQPSPALNTGTFVTQSELAGDLLALSNSLSAKFTPPNTPAVPEWVGAGGNPQVPYAALNNITNPLRYHDHQREPHGLRDSRTRLPLALRRSPRREPPTQRRCDDDRQLLLRGHGRHRHLDP